MGYFQLFGTNNTATNILVHMSFCIWVMFFKINFGHTALFICLFFYYSNFVELWSLCLSLLCKFVVSRMFHEVPFILDDGIFPQNVSVFTSPGKSKPIFY